MRACQILAPVRRPRYCWSVLRPDVQYAVNGDVSLAYCVVGDGPTDLILLLGGISHVDQLWEEPTLARYLERLAGFTRLIVMDRRGVGLSDPLTRMVTLDEEVEDVLTVLDAVGSTTAVVNGYGWGGPVAIRFARLHPERTQALWLYAAVARNSAEAGDPDLIRDEARLQRDIDETIESWGAPADLTLLAPSRVDDERLLDWFVRLRRMSASPGALRLLWASTSRYDASEDLPEITVPTLVTHRIGDRLTDIEHSRVIAAAIPGARYVELEGADNFPGAGDTNALAGEVEEFLTGQRHRSLDRALRTVLITDIVGSTRRAAELGDQRWSDLVAAHDAAVRRELDRHDGLEIKTMGDGFLATFDGAPSMAHRCALAIREAVAALGLELRAAIHTGECEIVAGDVLGIAVTITARITDLAGPGEILASGTAVGTVAGSGLRFEYLDSVKLKGVPNTWPIMRLIG